ncbi:MAG: hypothetical protein JXA72_00665 [Bacteroidales bacterium]|nr:hypothetical protein [Bacteroidales bacterium]
MQRNNMVVPFSPGLKPRAIDASHKGGWMLDLPALPLRQAGVWELRLGV